MRDLWTFKAVQNAGNYELTATPKQPEFAMAIDDQIKAMHRKCIQHEEKCLLEGMPLDSLRILKSSIEDEMTRRSKM